MTQTVYGQAADRCGLARNETRAWATPSLELRTSQPPRIPVNLNHGPIVGRVLHLEMGPGDNLWVIAEVRDHVQPVTPVRVGTELRHVATPWYWSLERISDSDWSDVVITAIGLTDSPARGLTAQPVTFRHGTANEAARNATDRHERDLLRRAADASIARRPGAPIVVAGHTDAAQEAAEYAAYLGAEDWRANPHDTRPELGDVERGAWRGKVLRVS